MSKKSFQNIVQIKKEDTGKENVRNNTRQNVLPASTPHKIDTIEYTRKHIREIAIEKIVPNPRQPRKYFAEESLKALAENIKETGVLQPISVRTLGDGRFELIFGERRWRASQLAGSKTIPCMVYENAPHSDEIALTENIQRDDLLPEEIAVAVKNIMVSKGYSTTEMASRVKMSLGTVSKCIKIASFVQTGDVHENLTELRSNGKAISFESLYMAAAEKSISDGIKFLTYITNSRLPTKEARKIVGNKKNTWDVKKIIRHLRSLNKSLGEGFDVDIFLNLPLIEKDKEVLMNAIAMTLESFKSAMQRLEDIGGKLEGIK